MQHRHRCRHRAPDFCPVAQASEAQNRVNLWQEDSQYQQSALQSALSLIQDHLQTAAQSCRSKLSQLQHWLSLPEASSQLETLSRQLQNAEQQLTQLRREAEQCEAEVRQASQQRPVQTPTTSTAGIAQAANSNPGANPRSAAGTLDNSRPGNQTSTTGRTDGSAGHGWASFRTPDQDRSGLMHSAHSSRVGNVWQPASQATTSTATLEAPIAAAGSMPVR